MPTRIIAGVYRSDAGLNETGAFTAGNTFSSDLITQIVIDLGADDTIFDGDTVNETPNDGTQTFDDGAGAGAFAYDFTVELIGSDGVTYQMVVFDYDINNDGNFGNGDIGGEDAGENSYFMAFNGAIPPAGITLTTTATFTDTSTSLPIENVTICFASGTLINTPTGAVPIENLTEGALVLTEDCGAQPIRWIGSKKLDAIDLAQSPKLKPVVIRADALGPGYPRQDLVVSPQHRILLSSAIAKRMFGAKDVLVPAKKLTGVDGIDVRHDNPEGVEYFHMLFDNHQIVEANGAKAESLFTGPEALKAVSPEAREEITELFPEICKPDFKAEAARLILQKGRQTMKLLERHQKNQKSLFAA